MTVARSVDDVLSEHVQFEVQCTITDRFCAAIRRFAATGHIPWVDFTKGQRKDDVMAEHLANFTATAAPQVARPPAAPLHRPGSGGRLPV